MSDEDPPQCPKCPMFGIADKADSRKGLQVKCVGCGHKWWLPRERERETG